jgi:hypothetical protein
MVARKILEIMYDKEAFIEHMQAKHGGALNVHQVGNPFFGKSL